MKKYYLLIFLFIFFTGINFSSLNAENVYKRLTALQCDSLVQANETNPNFVILDVRTPSQWQPDHLAGSINRNYYDADFTQQLDALPRNKTYLIHCQSGGRSSGTFSKMQNLEFAEVYEMIGGISAWKSASLPTTSVIEPKLMLVSYNEKSGNSNNDTIKVTITNRANDILKFNTVELFDLHEIFTDFDLELQLKGAEDYTFSVIHVPGYSGADSTNIKVESNGGNLELSLLFENGVIQNSPIISWPEVAVYPNPCSDFLYVSYESFQAIEKVSIFGLNGQLLFEKHNVKNHEGINVQQLNSGVYLLQLKTENQIQVQKIVIQHK